MSSQMTGPAGGDRGRGPDRCLPQPRTFGRPERREMPDERLGLGLGQARAEVLDPQAGVDQTGTAPDLNRPKVKAKKLSPERDHRTVRVPRPIPFYSRPAATRSLIWSSCRKVQWTCLARLALSRPARGQTASAFGLSRSHRGQPRGDVRRLRGRSSDLPEDRVAPARTPGRWDRPRRPSSRCNARELRPLDLALGRAGPFVEESRSKTKSFKPQAMSIGISLNNFRRSAVSATIRIPGRPGPERDVLDEAEGRDPVRPPVIRGRERRGGPSTSAGACSRLSPQSREGILTTDQQRASFVFRQIQSGTGNVLEAGKGKAPVLRITSGRSARVLAA